MLAQNVCPPSLVPTRETHEVTTTRQVIEDGNFLGHTDRILGTHHVTQGADSDPFGDGCPVCIENARVGPHLIPLRVEVVLDRADAPQTEIVCRTSQVMHTGECRLVQVPVAPERPAAYPLIPRSRELRIQLKNYFHHGSITPRPRLAASKVARI
jgi:hypothetical protein